MEEIVTRPSSFLSFFLLSLHLITNKNEKREEKRMAIVSEYVRGLGLIPLVIQPLTPKLFFKQKVPDGTYDVDTMGKAYLVTVAEQ